MSVQSVCVHAWGVVCGGCVNTGLHVPMEARHQLQISFLPQQHPTCFLKQGLLQEPRAHQVDWAGPWGSGLPMPLVLKLQLPRHTQLLPIVEKELSLLHLQNRPYTGRGIAPDMVTGFQLSTLHHLSLPVWLWWYSRSSLSYQHSRKMETAVQTPHTQGPEWFCTRSYAYMHSTLSSLEFCTLNPGSLWGQSGEWTYLLP